MKQILVAVTLEAGAASGTVVAGTQYLVKVVGRARPVKIVFYDTVHGPFAGHPAAFG